MATSVRIAPAKPAFSGPAPRRPDIFRDPCRSGGQVEPRRIWQLPKLAMYKRAVLILPSSASPASSSPAGPPRACSTPLRLPG